MLKNEAFKKYSANFAFLVGNVYSGGVILNTCSSSDWEWDPSGCLSEEKTDFSKDHAASLV